MINASRARRRAAAATSGRAATQWLSLCAGRGHTYLLLNRPLRRRNSRRLHRAATGGERKLCARRRAGESAHRPRREHTAAQEVTPTLRITHPAAARPLRHSAAAGQEGAAPGGRAARRLGAQGGRLGTGHECGRHLYRLCAKRTLRGCSSSSRHTACTWSAPVLNKDPGRGAGSASVIFECPPRCRST